MFHGIFHKLLRGFIVAGCALFFLELFLQCASLVLNYQLNKRITSSNSKGVAPHGKEASLLTQVLCVGDSYTQGVGASELKYSYPMQLQEYLRQKSSLSWEVINSGKAGTNSSELVQYIPRLFELYHPKYLCILVGVNDSWNFELRDAKDSRALKSTDVVPWKLRCRTYRLFLMLRKYVKDVQASKENMEGQASPASAGAFPYEEGGQKLSMEQLMVRGNELSNAHQFTEAVKVYEEAIRQYPGHKDMVSAEIQLASALAELKRMEEAFVSALSAQEKIRGQASTYHNALAWFFMRLCKFDLAKEEIEQYEKMFPVEVAQSSTLWGNYYFETYDYPAAEKYFLKALTPDNPQAPFAMRTLARIDSFDEAKLLDAKKLLMKAYAIDKDKKMTEVYLGIVDSSAVEKFPEILKQNTEISGMDRQTREEFSAMSKAFSRRQGGTTVLNANLAAIIDLCARHKVVPLFLTYPDRKEVNVSIRKFCSEQNLLLLDMEPKFTSLLEHSTFDAYFVIDAHPNNQGYGVMAQEVGDLLMARETGSQAFVVQEKK